MKTAVRIPWLLIFSVLIVSLVTCVFLLHRSRRGDEQPTDPHAGQVYLYDGFDWVWMTPLQGVEANTLTSADFEMQGTTPVYTGGDYVTLRGVDVSEHQLEIDWNQVAASGIDYAYIRVGRRGYSEGGLFEDPYFRRNMDGARRSGLSVGVYFFSQAVNVQEALEEAAFVLDHLQSYPVDLPVVFDWEEVEGVESARTKELSLTTRTDCAVAFCETVKNAGYTPAIYFNRRLGYYGYDLTRLTDYQFWFALPESPFPNFYYAVDMWQYSFTESISGIQGPTDVNLIFLPQKTDSGS